jgi:hypothetical protein
MVAGWNPCLKKKEEGTSFTSSTFPIQPDFSQNQPAVITLNTGSPRTLGPMHAWFHGVAEWDENIVPNLVLASK